ncbi:MAG: polysaccharide biosynthesis tyrosine autokinase [Balneolaceae bacterium]|nr:polysaccharide biosynthesis tyrosine autokinase [Balneolaceae bacterium]
MHHNGTNGVISPSNSAASSDNNNSEQLELDLLRFFNILLLRKYFIIGFTFIAGIIAGIYAYSQIPIYESAGTIMISQSQNRYSYAGSDLSSLLTTTYGIGVGSTIANELQILKSIKQSYELANRIQDIEYDPTGKRFPILWREYPVDSTVAGIDTIASRYRKSIVFERADPQSDVVVIKFESPSPAEAATVVNLTMDAYSSLSTEQNRTMAVSALDFLHEERNRIEDELTVVEDSLKEFMRKTNYVQISPQTTQLINQLADITVQIQSIDVTLFAVNATIYEYNKQIDEIKPGLAEQYSNALGPIIERAQFALSELETNKLQVKLRNPGIPNDHPEISKINSDIKIVKDEIKQLTNQLFDSRSDLQLSVVTGGTGTQKITDISSQLVELNVEKAQLETKKKVLNDYYDILDNDFQNLPDHIIQLSRLQRDVKINDQLFMLVSNQYAEMSLWEKTQFGMGRPLDYARPPQKPVSPKKKLILLVGLIIGGILSSSVVILIEIFNDKINSTEDLKELNLPVLGTIPDFSIMDGLDPSGRQFMDEKSVSNQLITFLDHISPLSEAYRRLRINVVYANPDKQYKVIMVTSANKGEGKSTVAANLAVTFSEAEKTVLIIDLDLRRPTQHKIFGENREPGLTDSLFETVSLSNIIRSTVAPNVDVLTVGKKTPEPATVLDSKRLKQLIDKLKERYDHIILDTAPYGIISDSASLLRLVDGLVVVTRFNSTTKRELQFTIDGLNHLNADILGMVLNAFNPEKSTDYYTNYAYYKRTYYSDYYKEEA